MPRPLLLSLLLTLNGGFVDATGFLALQGLFPAHVTGNFVTLPAALVLGTTGVLAKLLALPVFCVVIILVRLLGNLLRQRGLPVLQVLMALELLLLVLAASAAIAFGPFADGDAWTALATGMILVSAMALQIAVHRVHLRGTPPSTVMTGTTAEAMLDFADVLHGVAEEADPAVRPRLRRALIAIAAFGTGCALAALLYATVSVWCFVFPPVLALVSLWCAPVGSGTAVKAR